VFEPEVPGRRGRRESYLYRLELTWPADYKFYVQSLRELIVSATFARLSCLDLYRVLENHRSDNGGRGSEEGSLTETEGKNVAKTLQKLMLLSTDIVSFLLFYL
jgi:hypothetical protein